MLGNLIKEANYIKNEYKELADPQYFLQLA
jgi:hypothetical protein